MKRVLSFGSKREQKNGQCCLAKDATVQCSVLDDRPLLAREQQNRIVLESLCLQLMQLSLQCSQVAYNPSIEEMAASSSKVTGMRCRTGLLLYPIGMAMVLCCSFFVLVWVFLTHEDLLIHSFVYLLLSSFFFFTVSKHDLTV